MGTMQSKLVSYRAKIEHVIKIMLICMWPLSSFYASDYQKFYFFSISYFIFTVLRMAKYLEYPKADFVPISPREVVATCSSSFQRPSFPNFLFCQHANKSHPLQMRSEKERENQHVSSPTLDSSLLSVPGLNIQSSAIILFSIFRQPKGG